VPEALIDEISLVGPKDRIRDRLRAWKELGRDYRVASLVLTGATPEALRVVAEDVVRACSKANRSSAARRSTENRGPPRRIINLNEYVFLPQHTVIFYLITVNRTKIAIL
jgi:hypothetical protein